MFLAWSLILTGVSYARHRRLQYVLLKFFYASVDNSLTLICRRRNAHIFQQVQIKRVCSSKCTLYKAPSAPSISQSDPLSSWDVNEEVIYRNENEEVLVKCGKIIIQKREWNFHSSITVFDQCEHIFFIVQVSDKEFISAEWHGLRQFIDDSARSIAQHHNNSLLFLYETSFNNFQNIVFNWSEKALFKDSAVVEELYSIDSESLLAAEKLPPSFPNSKSNNSIESHALPSSLQFTDSDKFSEKAQTSSQLDACNGMSLSRNSFQSHTSSTSNVSDTSISISANKNCSQQPYSLLEALYFNELFGKYSHNEDSSTSNSLKLNAKICSSKPINKSDTCLPEHFDDYLSSSLSKVTKEKGENTSTKSSYGRYIFSGHSRSMSPSTKSVFATKRAKNSGMQWENSSYSASIVPNYFCKLRQESYSTHNNTQSSDQTETGSTYARDTVYVGVSPSTTLNDVSDCLMLDSKPSRHSEEISHDNTAAENRSPATKAQAAKVGKKGQSILMAYPLLTKSAAPTALNQLIEEHKSSLVGSTTMLNDDNAHSFSKSTCKADEQQKVAMDAIEDGLRTSLTQINEEKQSCSFAVNIKSTLPLLNKKKLLAKRFNSLQQPELDYYFYAPNFNYSMQFNNNTDIDNTAATTATSSRVKKRLSVSSVSGRSVSPLTLSLLANYGSREVLDPLLSANAAQPDSFLFSRRASSRNHRRFHSSEPRRSTLCLTDSGYKSILKSSLSSPKPPERMHSVFETANRPFKPPYILVYTGDEKELFQRISTSLKGILPLDTFTVNHLSTECLIRYPWFDTNCTCLLISNTKHLDDQAWSRLQAYFVNSGKILFVCQNHLLANLTNCRTLKKQTSILRNAFGKKSTSSALGKDLQKDFEAFMKKSLKKMEIEKEVNEAYHAKDVVGGYRFSVVFFKKIGQPLLLYMQNGEQKTQSSALFSDATTEQLLSSSLLGEALCRLGIEVVERGDPSNSIPQLTNGYLVCQKDRLLLDLKGLTYGKLVGNHPKLLFLHPATKENREEVSLAVDSKTLTVETRLRKASIEDSESNKYFNRLSTKSLGRVLIYIPVCETTLDVSKSLSRALPSYDGVLVVAGYQTNAQSRAGKEYLSPKGCASFTFNFVIPVDSCLGQSILFIQHIMAVAIVDAVSKLVDDENFPLQIKWPNDLYFERKHKIGGVLVDSLLKATQYECMIAGSINVINTKPTMCLNDMLPTDCDRTLTVEEVLAEIMNKFEYYVNMFVHRGKDAFLRRYYELWMHSREEVSILHKHNNCKEKVIIRGLDEHGFLEVRSKQTGQTFSVHNDGNSFDMMRGLIHPNQ